LIAAESHGQLQHGDQQQQQQLLLAQVQVQHAGRDDLASLAVPSAGSVQHAAGETSQAATVPAALQPQMVRPAVRDVSSQSDPGAGAGAGACAGAGGSVMIQSPQLAVCKFWVNTGRCAKGAACPYTHLQSAVLPVARNTWLKQL